MATKREGGQHSVLLHPVTVTTLAQGAGACGSTLEQFCAAVLHHGTVHHQALMQVLRTHSALGERWKARLAPGARGVPVVLRTSAYLDAAWMLTWYAIGLEHRAELERWVERSAMPPELVLAMLTPWPSGGATEEEQ